MCKVLIADDSEVMRTAIRKTLEEESKHKDCRRGFNLCRDEAEDCGLEAGCFVARFAPARKVGLCPYFGESTAGNRMHACHIVI
jgi:hypothetical protein